jgi:hypothetical protein
VVLLLCRALVQSEFEVGKASINATGALATPMGTENTTLGNSPSDVATVVLLPQTPHLDMQLVSDVGWVDYTGTPSCHHMLWRLCCFGLLTG